MTSSITILSLKWNVYINKIARNKWIKLPQTNYLVLIHRTVFFLFEIVQTNKNIGGVT